MVLIVILPLRTLHVWSVLPLCICFLIDIQLRFFFLLSDIIDASFKSRLGNRTAHWPVSWRMKRSLSSNGTCPVRQWCQTCLCLFVLIFLYFSTRPVCVECYSFANITWGTNQVLYYSQALFSLTVKRCNRFCRWIANHYHSPLRLATWTLWIWTWVYCMFYSQQLGW